MQFTSGGVAVATPPVQLFAGGVTYVYTPHKNGAFTFPAPAVSSRHGTAPVLLPDVLWFKYDVLNGSAIDKPPPIGSLPQWLQVVRNTCVTPIQGSAACVVALRAAPNTGGQRTADFQMSFENLQTGVPVPTQDVTLIQNTG